MSETTSSKLFDLLSRGDVFASECPSRAVLNHLTSKWGVLIMIALKGGTLRFAQLRRRIGGVSERMLAQTLQQLEADGMVIRKSYPEVPPRVEYSLSELGQEAAQHVEALADWVETRISDILAASKTDENN